MVLLVCFVSFDTRCRFNFFNELSPLSIRIFLYFSAEAGANIKPFFLFTKPFTYLFFIFFKAFWMLYIHCSFRERLGFGKAQLPPPVTEAAEVTGYFNFGGCCFAHLV